MRRLLATETQDDDHWPQSTTQRIREGGNGIADPQVFRPQCACRSSAPGAATPFGQMTSVMGPDGRNDVFVSPVGEEFDIIPVTPEAVRVVSKFLGSTVAPHVPLRMTDSEYRRFAAHAREHTDGGLSIKLKRRFRGQRLSDVPDLSETLPPQMDERLAFGRAVHLKDHNVTIACARYGSPPAGRLYKVTMAQHTPVASLALSIGTLDYYRDVVDKDEAAFTSSSSDGVLRTLDGKLIAGPETIKSLSIGISPCWIYCTTTISRRRMRPDQSAWFNDGDKATPVVSSVNHFARMLGASFAIWSMPRIRQVYEWIETAEVLEYTANGIMVVHGAVRYMEASERHRYLAKLHREDRELWMTEAVFTKNSDFAPEREYRFTVWGWGPPLQNHIVMPLIDPLSKCYGRSVAVSDLARRDYD